MKTNLFLIWPRKLNDELKPIDSEIERDEFLGTYSTYIGSPLYNGFYNMIFGVFQLIIYFTIGIHCVRYQEIWCKEQLTCSSYANSFYISNSRNFECIEPVISNIYSRRVLAGEFMVINEYLV